LLNALARICAKHRSARRCRAYKQHAVTHNSRRAACFKQNRERGIDSNKSSSVTHRNSEGGVALSEGGNM